MSATEFIGRALADLEVALFVLGVGFAWGWLLGAEHERTARAMRPPFGHPILNPFLHAAVTGTHTQGEGEGT